MTTIPPRISRPEVTDRDGYEARVARTRSEIEQRCLAARAVVAWDTERRKLHAGRVAAAE